MNTILLDLDGTMLPMDQDLFLQTFFTALEARIETAGFEKDRCMKAFMEAVKAMKVNDGMASNANVFLIIVEKYLGKDQAGAFLEVVDGFYQEDFDVTRLVTRPDPRLGKMVHQLKEKNYKLALATTPLFPKAATYKRMEWAGLNPKDFDLITTYENSHYAKPNPKYFKEIINKLETDASDCLMVGNDTEDDMGCIRTGMDIFFISNCLINKKNIDLSDYKQSDLDAFIEFAKDLPRLGKKSRQVI